MKKVMASIAVGAAMAALAGSAAATTQGECQVAIGYLTWKDIGGQAWNTGSGVWHVVEQKSAGFTGKNIMPGGVCPIPKNSIKKGTVAEATVDAPFDINTDLCSAFTTLASASQKVAAGKNADAYSILATFKSKLDTVAAGSKLTLDARDAIKTETDLAMTCVSQIQ